MYLGFTDFVPVFIVFIDFLKPSHHLGILGDICNKLKPKNKNFCFSVSG